MPTDQYTEMQLATTRQSTCLMEKVEQWMLESMTMNMDPNHSSNVNSTSPDESNKDILVIAASNDRTPLHTCVEENMDLPRILNNTYYQDPIFSKIMHGTPQSLPQIWHLGWAGLDENPAQKRHDFHLPKCILRGKEADQNHN